MRNFKQITLAIVALLSFTINAQTSKIDAKKSAINWVGKKVTGEHSGTIGIKDGALVFKKKALTGGNFTVDMTTIEVTDLDTNSGKGSLEGHLKADDFFGVDKYKTAKLVFTKVASKGKGVYSVTANLTIKDKTNPVTFDITVAGKTATAKVIVDRTKYDIKYNSKSFFGSIGDKAIDDEFELNVKLAW
jgi:polyisoprenoid-binding protein YceI